MVAGLLADTVANFENVPPAVATYRSYSFTPLAGPSIPVGSKPVTVIGIDRDAAFNGSAFTELLGRVVSSATSVIDNTKSANASGVPPTVASSTFTRTE